jgi:hypothetical protein
VKDLLLVQYNSASPSTVREGLHWYRKARRWAKELSAKTGVPLFKVVGVVAALSPTNKWDRNKFDTEEFIRTGGDCLVCTYGVQKAKAWDILHLAQNKEETLAILKGPKTKAFFHNIFHCLTDGQVTLDRWALRAVGHSDKKTPTKGQRNAIETAYREAAAEVGLRAHEFQAVIWERIRTMENS